VVIIQDEERVVQRLDFKQVHFSAQLLADSMQSDLAIVINDSNQLKGQVEVQGLTL
jgi:ribosomal protein L18